MSRKSVGVVLLRRRRCRWSLGEYHAYALVSTYKLGSDSSPADRLKGERTSVLATVLNPTTSTAGVGASSCASADGASISGAAVAAMAAMAAASESVSTGSAASTAAGTAAFTGDIAVCAVDDWRRLEAADCKAEMRRSITWSAEEDASAEEGTAAVVVVLLAASDCGVNGGMRRSSQE